MQVQNKPLEASGPNNSHAKASGVYIWPTTTGSRSAILCDACGLKFWDRFKNTNSGQGLIIRPLTPDDSDVCQST